MPIYGVAVTIPPPFGDQLREARQRFGDERAGGIPPHVTLLPPTDLIPALCDDLVEHLRGVASKASAFEMALAGTGTFRPVSPVVFVRVFDGAQVCHALESAIRSGPIKRPLDFPFHPHVTVAHHLDDAQLDVAFEALRGYEARFSVTGFDLYEQASDGTWHPVRHFALGGPA